MNRVCFVSVYFGKIPVFFKTFFDSCRWNKTFDWLIVHDQKIPYDYPENIKTLTIDIYDFKRIIEEKTGLIIPELKPYKVCDFRPAFGVIFEEYLENYEFWGICDTDLLLGDLRTFITDDLLNQYDKIFTMGHMSLVRNNDVCNHLFEKDTLNSRNYKEVFLDSRNCIYDEYLGFTEKFCDLGMNVYKRKVCADISMVGGRLRINEKWLVKCIQPNNAFHNYCKDKNYRHQIFLCCRGHIFRVYMKQNHPVLQEYSYIHKIDFCKEKELLEDDVTIITADGYREDEQISEKFMNRTLTKYDLDRFNKMDVWTEWKKNIYLYLLWKFRRIRNIAKGRLKD